MNFDFNRFLKQFKWDVLQNYRFLYIGYMVVFGLMLLFTSGNIHGGSEGWHSGFFWFTLFFGGLLFTSSLFDEMNSPQPKQFYLTTPSSHLEKFTSKLFLSSVIYTLLTMGVFTIMSFVATLIMELRTGENLPSFNPFFIANTEAIKSYLITQSIFLLGAITFRKVSFLKTLAILIGIAFVFSVIWATVGVASLMEFLPITGGDFDFNISGQEVDIEDNFKGYARFLGWLYALALAPAMWVVTYFKLTEKEV